MGKQLLILFLCIQASLLLATENEGKARFEENKGQLPQQVVASAYVPGGRLFIENQGFTWNFQKSSHEGHSHGGTPTDEAEIINGHSFKMKFLASSKSASAIYNSPLSGYSNYYIGKNSRNWASNVKEYAQVSVNDIYPGIDWITYSNSEGLKYDFHVQAGADPSQINMLFEGADHIDLKKGNLVIKTQLGTMTEMSPVAWQIEDGKKVQVDCKFKLQKAELSFELGEYDTSLPLIIDPLLVFGSFSGSTADNWGFTATYDNAGNTYSAGVVFGIGYPTSTGAYQLEFAGGSGSRPADIGIMKFDENGQRLFSTYLGGNSNELPQSLIVSSNNELFLFGTTGSDDFPTSSTAFSREFSGGSDVSILRSGVKFPNGTDMFICRLSENGQQLLASTYMGGSGNDGINTAPQLRYNYADDARGGIIIDNQNNVYVGCSTSSTDFPVPGNGFQSQFGGGAQDGIIVKLNMNLSTLFWGNYLGGSANDGIMSLTLDRQGNVFVAGGTSSIDFPVTSGTYQAQNAGAQSDGFISAISPNGQSLIASTYYGTDTYDQIFLISTSRDDGIYVYGQTEKGGEYYLENFNYREINGKQFITHFNHELTERVWSTTFGNGLAKPDITPSAFTVDICGQIFVCGWGGASNAGPDGGTFGGTNGLTTTADAFQTETDNNDFYLMVLDEQEQSLVYATFFGGATSSEHVDGGTSRFDRRGVVHQAVCAGCGGRDDFPTTPGVWSNVNGSSSGCNNAVFKFDFQLPATVASFTGPPIGCMPFEASFNNTSSFAEGYQWNINGVQQSQNENFDFIFQNPGLYTIQLIATNENSCNVRDTFTRQVRIVNSTRDVFDSLSICYLSSVEIGIPFPVDPYYQVSWVPELGLDEPDSQMPNASPEGPTNYILYLSLESCADTVEQFVNVRIDEIDAGPDLDICRGQTVQIGAPGDTLNFEYQWSPALNLSDASSANPLASVDVTSSYQLLRIPKNNANACPGIDSLSLIIPEGSPLADFETEVLASCTEVQVLIKNYSELAETYNWDFAEGFSDNPNAQNPTAIYQYGDTIHLTLIVENAHCRDTLTFTEPLKPLSDYFTINDANAFSPNGDGINDCFSPALQDLPAPDDKNFLSCSTLHIFDRWGKQVFESVESTEGCWNGNLPSGEACPDGTYFFIFKGQGQELQGNIELIR
ncbi:MAG: gliding motility-associated C-terminal domain-containing protein [Bacteroidia bacterium]